MAEGEPQAILLDANVFVAAIKSPSRETDTYRLIVHLLAQGQVRLVGNILLMQEYARYAEAFPSPTAAALSAALVQTMDIVSVEDRFILACLPHFSEGSRSDCVHAATCLQTGAVLVSNDRDFRSVAEAGLISTWTVAEAIRRLLPPSRR